MYLKRLRHEIKITIKEIPDQNHDKEGSRFLALLQKINGYSFALAEEGTLFTSRALASSLETKTIPLVFIIGGPEGLSDPVKKNVNQLLSLSRFTFTHELARVLLMEQLYRALSILNHRAYHKE
jgi:23S rRNA (pseudouridine1915-N3)-methyltransferase